MDYEKEGGAKINKLCQKSLEQESEEHSKSMNNEGNQASTKKKERSAEIEWEDYYPSATTKLTRKK